MRTAWPHPLKLLRGSDAPGTRTQGVKREIATPSRALKSRFRSRDEDASAMQAQDESSKSKKTNAEAW